jgi:hypothetical protein
MRALAGEVADHRLALDQLGHEYLGRDPAGLARITDIGTGRKKGARRRPKHRQPELQVGSDCTLTLRREPDEIKPA